MITFFNCKLAGTTVDKPTLIKGMNDLVVLASTNFSYLLPNRVKLTGIEFAKIILENNVSAQAKAVAEILIHVDALPPHYIFKTCEDVPEQGFDYKKEIAITMKSLLEQVNESFRLGARNAYSFSFENEYGKNSMGLVFGHDADSAYNTIKHLKNIKKPSDTCPTRQNLGINGSMTIEVMSNVTRETFFGLEIINHKVEQLKTA